MATIRLGKDGKLYHGTAGSTASTEAGNVTDVTLTFDKTMVETMRRSSQGWESQKAVSKKLTIKWTMMNISGDAFLTAIKNAFLGDTAIALAAKDAEGGEGPDADFDISSFERGEPIKGVQTYNVTAEINDELRVPTWA